jgi:hypothetical protein
MPENTVNAAGRFKEAVCIETGRIFDSCSDKDCLEDLQVCFKEGAQEIINESSLVKCKSAEVLDVRLTVEPVPFNNGYYAVDMSFFFRVHFAAYSSPVATPVNVRGLAIHSKKCILYGSQGNVRSFCSGDRYVPYDYLATNNMPIACLKVADPITLACRVADKIPDYSEPVGPIPEAISKAFDGDAFVLDPDAMKKVALVTIGLFTLTTLERSVQLMVPAYDYSVPEKECLHNMVEDPCEMFKHINFPVREFFPEAGGVREDE